MTSEVRQTASPSGYRLRVEVGGEMRIFVVRRGDTTIGALPENDLSFELEGLSRRHAILREDEGVLTIEDLESKNGTFVDGVRISRAELAAGSCVDLPGVTIRVEKTDPEDQEVAISLEGCEPSPSPHPITPSRVAPVGRRKTDEPPRWIELVNELGAAVLGAEDPVMTDFLGKLVQGIGATGACLFEWHDKGAAAILAIWDQGQVVPPLDQLDEVCAGASAAGREQAVVASFLLGEERPLAVAVASSPALSTRGLLLWGDFPHRPASTPLLELVLRLTLNPQPEHIAIDWPPAAGSAPPLLFPDGHVVGKSAAMMAVYEQLQALVQGDIPVLISGETGVGKEHIARILHLSSKRRNGPFQIVHCAAIPADLLEAELFGIEKGVATGVTGRKGTFELAAGGIVFLDEISEMPPPLQAKMLRVLQCREVQPVGAGSPRPIDVRILAATNSNPEQLIRDSRFRRDLYFRIAGFNLSVPPLQQRREDIPALVEDFLRRSSAEVGKRIRGISVKALRALVFAPWPGNVRQLELEVRRLVYMCPSGHAIDSTMLPADVLAPSPRTEIDAADTCASLDLDGRVADLERQLVVIALARTKGNRAKAARLLGVSRNGLLLKMERLGIQ